MDQQIGWDDETIGPVIVFNMQSEYQSLEGEYQCIHDIHLKLYKLIWFEDRRDQYEKWIQIDTNKSTRKIIHQHNREYVGHCDNIGEYKLKVTPKN